jgi:hypothetical protein
MNLYQNESRVEFRKGIDEWLHNREWSEGERYPFGGIEGFLNECQQRFPEWYGWERLGETLIISGGTDGGQFWIHLNPTTERENFKTVWRWG